MKNILIAIILLFSMNTFSQQTENLENAGINNSKVEVKDSIKMTMDINTKSILNKSGYYMQKSAYYEYGAIGSFAASIGLMFIAFNNIDFWNGDNANITTSAISAVAATLFFTSAIVCTIASIRYDKKAGKELKLFMRGGAGTIAITF
ncbi:hypothetical protein [uncultured Bacteroides sp.]|uniref:hypothetical protein n=1 Tax=uncultured Bacteroides sp. TaxID=162156 RepID=UPI002AAAA144|nr:hypothetical protein [uncultured Bacteroides sp.]